jgi:hypothetical protein
VFSDLSLVFKDKFDVVASITYTLVVVRLILSRLSSFANIIQVLDAAVIVAAAILNPRARRKRERERALQMENVEPTRVELELRSHNRLNYELQDS